MPLSLFAFLAPSEDPRPARSRQPTMSEPQYPIPGFRPASSLPNKAASRTIEAIAHAALPRLEDDDEQVDREPDDPDEVPVDGPQPHGHVPGRRVGTHEPADRQVDQREHSDEDVGDVDDREAVEH